MKNSLVLLFGLLFLFIPQVTFGKELTCVDLIDMLTDLERLSVLPDKGETAHQWSSYDRASRYDEANGKYVNWEANSDGFSGLGWIRIEDDKLVLAEMEGPGCIWRIWSASPSEGHVRIYLDGQAEPVVDLPFIGYFNGQNKPFTRDALVHIVASGKNCYVPIPFQKSCKIVADRDYGEFHHFGYTVFPKNTQLPTFSRNLSDEEKAALDRANEFLKNCGPRIAKYGPDERIQGFETTIGPGQTEQVLKLEGPRAITSIVAKGELPEGIELQRQVLRELVLKIYWDGDDKPSVWCPLGDFFGTAPGANHYKSLPLGITEQGGYCNWYMPFSKEARIELLNEGNGEATVEFEITHAPLKRPAGDYGRFHAKWHRDAFLPGELERWIDWPMLKTTGRGRFCGVELEIWNPRGGWWGEGDEKFFIDGEKFPSVYGTGSEDYFGYAWSDPTLFENCYHNQTVSEYNKGHISVNRWHIVDNVPFQKSFEGCIEKYFSNSRPTLYSCVAYWYLEAGGDDPYEPVPISQRIGWYERLKYPLDVAGILVLEEPIGSLEAQGMHTFTADRWSNNEQLWWVGKPGGRLRIGIEVEKEGRYKIITRMTKARDYGIIQWKLNDRTISEPMDMFYADDVIATDDIELGNFFLSSGQHELNVEMVGINPDAIKRYMAGIDYIKVLPVDTAGELLMSDKEELQQAAAGQVGPSMFPALPLIPAGVSSRAITWENRQGLPGKGGMAASKLGVGRKGSPCMGWIKNGSTVTLMDVNGCGVIRHIWMTFREREPNELRNIILRMYWDDSEVPSVEVPLGDFFGTAHGRTVNMNSAYISVIEGKGFNCWFPMPFRKNAKVTITNDMQDDKRMDCLFFQIDYELHESLPENTGLFHAQFRRQNPTVPKRDFVVLDNVEGPGYFAGCVIGIRPLKPFWWGEGEMKFYIDGDTDFPTICGTGTEDYFGCAWGMNLYQTPYLGCTLLQPPDQSKNLKELVSMYRFHVLDPVYFKHSLKATIQQIGWGESGLEERDGDDWCSVAYWYQREPVKQMPPLPDREQRTAGIIDEKKEKKAKDDGQWSGGQS